MVWRALFLTLGLLGSASATFDCATSKTGCTALDDYVAAEDDAYNWVDLNITIEGPGWTAHVLNLTSQKWLTSNDCTRATLLALASAHRRSRARCAAWACNPTLPQWQRA